MPTTRRYAGAWRGAGLDDFDLAFNAVQSGSKASTANRVRSFADAGGTWWIEFALDVIHGGPDQYRERIRHGPPTAS